MDAKFETRAILFDIPGFWKFCGAGMCFLSDDFSGKGDEISAGCAEFLAEVSFRSLKRRYEKDCGL